MKFLKKIILAIFALSSASCNEGFSKRGFDNSYELQNSSKVIAFVGKKIDLKPDEFYPPENEDADGDEILIYMDSRYIARYEILELVHGDYEKKTIDFHVYDHYGTPNFSKNNIVLLYVIEHDGELIHKKYTYDVVEPTIEGKWAFCGDPYLDFEGHEIDQRPLENINFFPRIVYLLNQYQDPELYDQKEIKAYLSEPAFEISGNIATCKMGAYPDELFRIKYETLFLWNERNDICREKLGPAPDYKESEPIKKQYSDEKDQCIKNLRESNTP